MDRCEHCGRISKIKDITAYNKSYYQEHKEAIIAKAKARYKIKASKPQELPDEHTDDK